MKLTPASVYPRFNGCVLGGSSYLNSEHVPLTCSPCTVCLASIDANPSIYSFHATVVSTSLLLDALSLLNLLQNSSTSTCQTDTWISLRFNFLLNLIHAGTELNANSPWVSLFPPFHSFLFLARLARFNLCSPYLNSSQRYEYYWTTLFHSPPFRNHFTPSRSSYATSAMLFPMPLATCSGPPQAALDLPSCHPSSVDPPSFYHPSLVLSSCRLLLHGPS